MKYALPFFFAFSLLVQCADAAPISTLDAFSGTVDAADELIINDYDASPVTRRIDASQLFSFPANTEDTEWNTLAKINAATTDDDAVGLLDIDTFAELDALVADQTLLNANTGYTQAAADAAFEPLGVAAADLTDATADGIALVTSPDANPFTDLDESKLDGIEALADITDTANVTSAGALMDSEVDADLKTLSLPASTTISAFGATLADDADAATARTTLGLGNVDNTADADKPISTATQAELDAALARDNKRAFAGGVLVDGTQATPVSALSSEITFSDGFFFAGFVTWGEIGADERCLFASAGLTDYIRLLLTGSINLASTASGSVTITPDTTFVEAQKYHLAIVRNSSDLVTLYIDGVAQTDTETLAGNFRIQGLFTRGTEDKFIGEAADWTFGNFTPTATEAAELSSNGLEAFIAAHPEYQWAQDSIITAESSNSTFTNGTTTNWSVSGGGISATVDDANDELDIVGNAGNSGASLPLVNLTESPKAGDKLRVTVDVAAIDFGTASGWLINIGSTSDNQPLTTTGAVAWDVTLDANMLASGLRITLDGAAGGNVTISLTSVTIEKLGIVAALPLDEGIGYQHRDLSSNHYDALASATGVYHLKTKREGSLRAFGIDAYNGGSGDVELVSSSRDVLPPNAIIKESFVRNNGAGSIASGALDVKRSNRTTRNIIGDNGGVLDGGLVENITITAQQTPTYNNVALDASTDADATDIDVRIDYELID